MQKEDKYLIRQIAEKSVEYVCDIYTNCSLWPWNGYKRLGKEFGWTSSQSKNRDHTDYSLTKILRRVLWTYQDFYPLEICEKPPPKVGGVHPT